MTGLVTHTAEVWEKILGAQILDADGWRTGNPYGPCDFYNDKITREDFDRRYRLCTVNLRAYSPPK